MNTAPFNTKTSLNVKTICCFIVPFVLKRVAVISLPYYWVLLVVSSICAIMTFIMYKKKVILSIKIAILFSSFAISTLFCQIISYKLAKKAGIEQITLNFDSTFRERYEIEANKGNVHYMELLGKYYSFPEYQFLLQASPGVVRDDYYFDTRNYNKALKYLKMASEKNSAEAYALLGKMSIQGLGCTPSRIQAINYFKNAYIIDNTNKILLEEMLSNHITIEELFSEKSYN